MDTADEHLFCVLQSLDWHEIVDPLNGNLLGPLYESIICGFLEVAIYLHLNNQDSKFIKIKDCRISVKIII